MESFVLTLRVRGPNVDPSEITRRLGVAPSESFRRGDAIQTSKGPLQRQDGAWLFCIEENDCTMFSARLKELVSQVPCGVLVDDPIAGTRVDVFVGLFGIRDQSSFEIDPETLAALSARRWPLVFDMYR